MKSATPETRLSEWRKAVGLSQKDLARVAGVSQAHISQVEQGMTAIGGELKMFLQRVNRRRNTHFPIK